MNRYDNGAQGNKSTPELSYVNTTDRESAMIARHKSGAEDYSSYTGHTGEIVHKIESQSSLEPASYINSSQHNYQ